MATPAMGIRGHSIEFISNALRELKASGANFVSVRSIVERWNSGEEIGPDEIAFTFDDGFADQGELLQAAFIPVGCPATVFLITDFIDGRLWPWDDQLGYIFRATTKTNIDIKIGGKTLKTNFLSASSRSEALEEAREAFKSSDNENLYSNIAQLAALLEVELPSVPPPEYRPLSWEQARVLAAQGIDFGPHSISHRIFSRLSAHTVWNEIERSWTRVKEEIPNPLPVFAWPTGRHTDYESKDIELAKQAGLVASMATDDDYSYMSARNTHDDLFRIKRFALPNRTREVLRYGSWIERGRQLLPI